jgi:CheY-like chemotaxis protein
VLFRSDLFADQARRKSLAFACDLPADLPERVFGDPVRVRQVLGNLLANAVKFTERGGVELALRRVAEDRDGVELRFEVRDTGVGIAPQEVAGIFDSFSQADGSTARRYGGTGLGLTISRQLAEMMGGTVGVQSRSGEGSVFWFAARFDKACAARAGDREPAPTCGVAPAPEARFAGRVLLAEDNAVNQEVTSRILNTFGLRTDVVDNGRAAVERWRAGAYDLILMDCQMPGLDGYQAARLIREEEARRGPPGRRVPIVALTAHALDGDRELSLAAGMDDHLAKPFRLTQIGEVLARWLPAAPADHAAGDDAGG